MTVNSPSGDSGTLADQGSADRKADLVLEGGGVRGIGLAGAVLTLDAAGYKFERVAGTSAGSIVAALVAALDAAGQPLSRLTEIMKTIDYPKFMNRAVLGDAGLAERLVAQRGLYNGGAYLRTWLGKQLEDIGITKFSQLRRTDSGADSNLRESQQYSLVICASDITRRVLARLPWDYPRYGLNPDDQLIVEACIPSMSIPFFFKPYELNAVATTVDGVTYPAEQCTWVDGGVLDDYPVDMFDRTDGRPSRWETIGIKLEARQTIVPPARDTGGLITEVFDVMATALNNSDRCYIGPGKAKRTVFIDTGTISSTDFDINADQQAQLFEWGQNAAHTFLAANSTGTMADKETAS
jgi:NTE family protein